MSLPDGPSQPPADDAASTKRPASAEQWPDNATLPSSAEPDVADDRSLSADPPSPPSLATPTHCANCGTPLQGPYCHQCGQHMKTVLRHVPGLVADGLDIVFNIDGRIMPTLPALYFHPGRLTLEYFAGRRVRYITPFRLVFFLAIIAFLSIQLVTRANLGPAHAIQAVSPVVTTKPHNPSATPAPAGSTALTQTPLDVSKVKLPHIAWLPNFANTYLDEMIERGYRHLYILRHGSSAQIKAEYRQLLSGMFTVAPTVLLVLLPIFALLLTVFYVFKRRLYIEHLIVAMHSHAFLLLSVLILLITGLLRDELVTHATWLATPFGLLDAALWIWIFIYLFVMQKRVYRQGWIMTTLKFSCIALCYGLLLVLALVAAALISFVR